jgi:hypothetical protein
LPIFVIVMKARHCLISSSYGFARRLRIESNCGIAIRPWRSRFSLKRARSHDHRPVGSSQSRYPKSVGRYRSKWRLSGAYKYAAQIQLALPDEDADLEDIVAAMLAGRGNIQVIEFDPPALIVPSPDKDETTETPSLGGLVDISGERQSIS